MSACGLRVCVIVVRDIEGTSIALQSGMLKQKFAYIYIYIYIHIYIHI